MKFFIVLIIRGKEDSIRTKLGDEKLKTNFGTFYFFLSIDDSDDTEDDPFTL